MFTTVQTTSAPGDTVVVAPGHFICLLLIASSVVFSGCLATISRIAVPPEVAVEEECAFIVRGEVEGTDAGMAGLAVQVPTSFQITGGYYLTKYGRRPLRRFRRAEERYEAESGYAVIILGDSVRFLGDRSGWVHCIISFMPVETGTFTIKMIGGGAPRRGGTESWISTDPPKMYRFADLHNPQYTSVCLVREGEMNGTACISFEGERSYVALPPGPLLEPIIDSSMTVEWIFRSTATDAVMLSDRQDDIDGAHRLEVGIDDLGRLYLSVSDGYRMETVRDSIPVSDGVWHHVAVTSTGRPGTYRLFLNGVCRDSLVFTSRNIIPARRFFLGSRGGRVRFFRGMMEEFRMWRRIRSDHEIRFFRDVALSGHEEGLSILYSFDQTSQDSIFSSTQDRSLHAVGYNNPKIVASTAPLQLEFSTFRAEAVEDSVFISWETFEEKDIRYFELEKRLESGYYFALERIDPVRSEVNYHRYQYRDAKHSTEAIYYRLRQVNIDGSVHFSPEIVIGLEEVHNFTLEQNDPDPFGSSSPAGIDTTRITYHLQETTHVLLTVYDMVGRVVAELVNGRQKAGTYVVNFSGGDLPSGIYFFKLRAESGSQTRKMSLER